MRKKVLLLRAGDTSGEIPPGQAMSCPWEQALRAAGFEAATHPALKFEYEPPETLRGLVGPVLFPGRHAGWIFTSPRAVEAFGRAFPAAESGPARGETAPESAWKPSKLFRAFAVGPRTAAALRTLGYEPEGEEAGSAEHLANHILKQRVRGPLLFLCGDRRRAALPEILRAGGLSVEEAVVYRTRLRTLQAWPGGAKPDWIVFFSPSGLEAMLRSAGVSMEGLSIAAIGAVTARAIRTRGFNVLAVAEEPAPEALAQALRTAR